MMNRATPITSALKRKYSPLKETKAQKEAKKLLVDESGESVYAQTSIKKPGTTETKKRLSYKEAWDQDVDGIRTSGMYKDYGSYVGDREGQRKKDPVAFEEDMVAATGVSGGPGTVTTTTPGSEEKSKVKLKTGITGTTKRSYQSREDLRGGTQAASKSKRAATSEARAQNKLAKMGYDKDNPLKPGDKGYVKQQRLLSKIDKQQSRQRQAGAEVENFARMSEEGKTGAKNDTFYKGQRDKEQGELTIEEQGKAEVNTSGPGAAKKFFGDLPKDISSDLQMKFSPAKFKASSVKAPMKKLSNLSGDGSPTKYGNKKSPYKMKGYGSKRY